MDAICFALFNKPFRRINKPQLVNTINGRKAKVTVNFEIGKTKFKIVRGIKPTIFEIYKDGKLLEQDAANRDYQDYLEKQVLKMSYKTFCQVVVLGSANWTAFMSLSAANRRKIIEDLLDIEVFSTMNILLKDRQNIIKDATRELEKDLALIENTLKLNQQHRESVRANSEKEINRARNVIAKHQGHIAKIDKQLSKLNMQIESAENAYSAVKDLSAKQTSLQQRYDNTATSIVYTEEQIRFFDNNTNCPTCSQEITDETKDNHSNHLRSELDELFVTREKISKCFKKVDSKLDTFAKVKKKLDLLQSKKSELQTDKHIAQSAADTIQKEIDRQVSSIDEEVVDESDVKQQKKELLSDVRNNSHQQHLHGIASTLLKDNGIKTQIIRQYVPIMNTLINKYLERLDFFCQFKLNESFEESIKARYKDSYTYDSFSQGEKARIDLALLFTWRAIAQMRNTSPCNLLILDEVFDGSLDISGAKNLIQMITELTNTNIIVISHTQSDEDFDRVITVTKNKNYSKYQISS